MRTWPGLAAIGAGLIHLGSAPEAPPVVLAVLVLVGGAELLWGVAALGQPVPPAPVGAGVALMGVALLTAEALLLPPAAAQRGSEVSFGLSTGAVLGAAALDLALGGLLALHLGRGRPQAARQGALRFLVAAGAAAAAVAFVTIQSLAGTSSGGTMPMH
ncbi:hypothetical protein [uncultured Amnibacterium sp.]|uniref:hypothetical protein n=1 Tax=uncultured Amnibacterium sp. TaxID=1631851 RepID=UPI0035C9B95F